MNKQEKIEQLAELINCFYSLEYWHFNEEGHRLSSTCKEEILARELFLTNEEKDVFLTFASQHNQPTILPDRRGMLWIIAPDYDGKTFRGAYCFGPSTVRDIAGDLIRDAFSMEDYSEETQEKIRTYYKNVPQIPLSRMFEYAIMAHFCLTGAHICVSDLHYRGGEEYPLMPEEAAHTHDFYEEEVQMLNAVRMGDFNYQEWVERIPMGAVGKLSNNPDRQMKDAALMGTVLFSRAAIDGGLAPETALTMCDNYIQNVEACRTVGELREISQTMQKDYVTRVHRIQEKEIFSKEIQECADFIVLHPEEELTLESLAIRFHCAPYYLSRRFKNETGISLNAYIYAQRVETAKRMLRNTVNTSADISKKLHFCTPSHFADKFKELTGMTPEEYRNAGEHKIKKKYIDNGYD